MLATRFVLPALLVLTFVLAPAALAERVESREYVLSTRGNGVYLQSSGHYPDKPDVGGSYFYPLAHENVATIVVSEEGGRNVLAYATFWAGTCADYKCHRFCTNDGPQRVEIERPYDTTVYVSLGTPAESVLECGSAPLRGSILLSWS